MAETSDQLLEHMAVVARAIDTGNIDDTLRQTIAYALSVVPDCEHAAVSLTRRREVTTPATSDDIAGRFVALEVKTGEGPSLDALGGEDVVHTDDLATERRWPSFVAEAADASDVSSALAVRLFARGRTMGSLTLLSKRPAAFGDDDIAVATLFSAIAAVALGAASEEAGLRVSVLSRDVIGRAKGILMERHKVTDDEAFERLTTASQRMNIRLAEVAERLARTGEEGGAPPR